MISANRIARHSFLATRGRPGPQALTALEPMNVCMLGGAASVTSKRLTSQVCDIR
jgi:hypothetical protein